MATATRSSRLRRISYSQRSWRRVVSGTSCSCIRVSIMTMSAGTRWCWNGSAPGTWRRECSDSAARLPTITVTKCAVPVFTMSLAIINREPHGGSIPLGIPVWRTCLREVLFSQTVDRFEDAVGHTLLDGRAYRLLLEILCGLQSPMLGD